MAGVDRREGKWDNNSIKPTYSSLIDVFGLCDKVIQFGYFENNIDDLYIEETQIFHWLLLLVG